jgi:hypothetical protein
MCNGMINLHVKDGSMRDKRERFVNTRARMRQFAIEIMLDKTQRIEHRLECLQVLRQLEGYGRQPKPTQPPNKPKPGGQELPEPRFDIQSFLANIPETEDQT